MTWTWLGVAMLLPQAVAGGGSARQSPVDAIPVVLVAPELAAEEWPAPVLGAECDPLGLPVRCFTPPASPASGRYLNVASFFDARARSLGNHFFLKFFDNAAGVAVDIEGLGTYVRFTSPSANAIAAAGVIRTSRARPVLPTPDELLDLQVVAIPAAPLGVETCVDFSSPIRLEADQAAWLVLRFPTAPVSSSPGANVFGVLVDTDATDLDCDYMTPDAGQYYYRPDPRNGPPFDWAISAYTSAAAQKDDDDGTVPWTVVKRLYGVPEAGKSQ